jgi:hypothetical protein
MPTQDYLLQDGFIKLQKDKNRQSFSDKYGTAIINNNHLKNMSFIVAPKLNLNNAKQVKTFTKHLKNLAKANNCYYVDAYFYDKIATYDRSGANLITKNTHKKTKNLSENKWLKTAKIPNHDIIPKFQYLINLDKKYPEILSNFNNNVRRYEKRAVKLGVKIKKTSALIKLHEKIQKITKKHPQ